MPRPQTQIAVYDRFGELIAYLDMGWEDIKVAAEYDGQQHRTDRMQYAWDSRRREKLEELAGSSFGSWPGISRPMSSGGCGPLSHAERHSRVTFNVQRDSGVTLGGKAKSC